MLELNYVKSFMKRLSGIRKGARPTARIRRSSAKTCRWHWRAEPGEREDMAQLAPPTPTPSLEKKHKRGKSCYGTRIAYSVFRRRFQSMFIKSRHAMRVLRTPANSNILSTFRSMQHTSEPQYGV